MQIELNTKEIEFLKNELDYRLKKCTPLGHPTSNSTQLPKVHADFYNSLYKKLHSHDHIDYIRYKETLK
jgi:hypothetical protein